MIDLVLRENEFTSFTSFYLEDFWKKFFNISLYDPTKKYNKNRTLFAVWWQNVDSDPWVKKMKEDGYKLIVDNIWEKQTFRKDFYWIEHKYSMRWNESLWWESLGYSEYTPKKRSQYIALMQLRLKRPERDIIVDKLDFFLNQMLWSYLAKNKKLPYDTDDENSGQRYMHPFWYDTTYCSLVVETSISGDLHVSEKSYKPIAYYHPFMSLSVPGTLQFLKDAGFETFDNLFNEDYDNIESLDLRLEIIKENLRSVSLNSYYDKLTLDKLEHNHNHFFNKEKILFHMQKEIIEPILEYAET
jgi:hypothetical protein